LEFFAPGLGLLVVDDVVVNEVVLEPSPVSVYFKGKGLDLDFKNLGVKCNNHCVLIPSPCLFEGFFNVLNRQLISNLQIRLEGKFSVVSVKIIEIVSPCVTVSS
jgi:hypothetical protein